MAGERIWGSGELGVIATKENDDCRWGWLFICPAERIHGCWSGRELAQDVPLSERNPTAASGG